MSYDKVRITRVVWCVSRQLKPYRRASRVIRQGVTSGWNFYVFVPGNISSPSRNRLNKTR